LTIVLLLIVNAPAGATTRVHQLPNESRYAAVDTDGSNRG
jgi:hypothetical protein